MKYTLVKALPGSPNTISINFDSESELRDHLIAMWKHPDYVTIAIFNRPA